MSEVSEATPLPTVLVVDDKANMLTLLAKVLHADARVLKATSGAAAIQLITEHNVDVVVCDLRMPDLDGLAVLDAVRRLRPRAQFILMTAYGTVPNAIDAMKRGAFDYVTKPFEPEQLRQVVLRALGRPTADAEATRFEPLPGMIGASLAMAELARMVRRFAASDVTALVLGETGTGKELVARALHSLGPRSTGAFVALSCGAMPSETLETELFGRALTPSAGVSERGGLFEEAENGTLFLDEIGELRLSLQAKLTRVLEERRIRRPGEPRDRVVNARVVAATHRDIEAMAREGSFREDLLYRLRVATIHIPPLRERSGDVALLASHFLELAHGARASAFSPEATLMLERYRWPGNVRELRAAVERAAIVAEGARVEATDLPNEIRSGSAGGPVDLASMSYQQALEAAREDATRRYLEAVLGRTKGKVVQAAEIAGIERESFYRLLRRYGVSPDDFRGE